MVERQVKVIEQISQQVLFQCDVKDQAKAYQFAREMEEIGVAVQIQTPSVSQTLAHSLGVKEQDWQEYQRSMEEELEDHDCCSTMTDSPDNAQE